MANSLALRVVTPAGSQVELDAVSISATSGTGQFCLLPGHRPMLCDVRPGLLRVGLAGGETVSFVVDSGLLESGHGHVSITSDHCVSCANIDGAHVHRLRTIFEERLRSAEPSNPLISQWKSTLAWLEAQDAASHSTQK